MSTEPHPAKRKRAGLLDHAAESAPTAPHATLRGPGAPTGPERFWARKPKALALTLVASLSLHWLLSPWAILPQGSVEIKDQDGELLIPTDLVEDPEPAKPPPAQAQQEELPTGDGPGPGGARDAGPPKTGIDAGAKSAADAGVAIAQDAGAVIIEADGSGIAYLDDDGGAGDAGAFGRDPGSLIGGLGNLSAGTNNVTVLVNFEVMRSHPLGPRIQPILAAIPEWKAFMAGSSIDAYRDTDWMMIFGPNLIDTTKDVVVIHYSAPDGEVDKAIGAIAATYAKGGAMDVGVPGVKVTRFFAHGAERAFLRPRSHTVLIVPSSHAKVFAQVAARPLTPRFKRGEALSVRAMRPGGSVSFIPQSVSMLDMYIVARSDGGGDLYAEGTCPDSASATQAADDLKNSVTKLNSLGVKLVTAGVLNGFATSSDGNIVKAHLPGSKEQIEAIVGLVGARLGVPPPASP